MNLRVYVSCALTHAPPEYKEMIFSLKDKLREVPWIDVLSFVTTNTQQPDPDKSLIYYNDIHACVGTAHALISELSYPSLGLGWEMGAATEKHAIPIFMCAREDALVSSLPIGASLHHEQISLWRYQDSVLELFDRFIEELQELHTQLQLKEALS